MKTMRDELNEREKKVLSVLKGEPQAAERIAELAEMPLHTTLATLLVLDVRRQAKKHDGNRYSKCDYVGELYERRAAEEAKNPTHQQ